MSSASSTSSDSINEKNSMFFCCDIQETFRNKIYRWDSVIKVSSCMNQLASILSIPTIVTEQQPFKPTVEEIDTTNSENIQKFSKHHFSMYNDEIQQYIQSKGCDQDRKHIVIYGIETHICVLQTCLHLLKAGYNVYLVSDASSSQREEDRSIAMRRMEREGVKLTTSESILYEILGDSKHEKFKAILPIVKELSSFKKKDVAET